jgi:hypothetical protein
LLVDGHVHLYPNYDVAEFFRAAVENLAGGAAALSIEPQACAGALIFTESHSGHAFDALADGAMTLPRPWAVNAHPDEVSIVVGRESGESLLVVAGQQAVTREGLEVLGFGIRDRCPDGLALEATIEWIRSRGALAVLPWGFGKWSFRRGRLIERLLDDADPAAFAVGDNGGRLASWPAPRLLRQAEARGYAVLPGSDPLPFASQAGRVGSSGFVLEAAEPEPWTGRALVERLRALRSTPRTFRRLTGLPSFVCLQVAMQLQKAMR